MKKLLSKPKRQFEFCKPCRERTKGLRCTTGALCKSCENRLCNDGPLLHIEEGRICPRCLGEGKLIECSVHNETLFGCAGCCLKSICPYCQSVPKEKLSFKTKI